MNEFVQKLDMETLGERLSKVRMHLKMKQSEVADEIGCASQTISRMERGETSTSILPLLVFYSQSVSLDILFGKKFDPEDDALYNKNPAMDSHVKARLKLLQEDTIKHIADKQKEFDVNVHAIADKLLKELNEQMLNYTKSEQDSLLRRLDDTIELL